MNQKYSSLLNQIPTKLRGKYISLIRNKKKPEKDLVSELEGIITETNQRILPEISYPDLPVAEKVDEIKKLIQENQVVVVAGETGSGKSTQLPKICLDLGLGKRGLIAHTQPRRLAARSIANRIAAEIGDQSKVSYKIRFSDQTSNNTLIKVMTDGVLLSEIKNDRYLSQYEVIIIDEAHERSLNIDFLMGCIKKILPFRPDLKVIITSATIDHQKFINYFDKAKDITILGRTYPVEIRYQGDEEFLEFSLQERILYAIEELGRGDVLVFLPTERDIHETLAYLSKQDLRFTEVLPLFSRLSNKDQNKIFNPEGSIRRVILATNVAETSLTVPRIKYVIDSGLARVSRYSYRTKVQRLPIEKISQASANQRAGRCGRLSSGVCVRLYSEEDFLSRKEFTDPEILRTNLASVILQMLFLKLGNVQDFPFIDAPDSRFVKDGFKLLFELKAIPELNYSKLKITQDGMKMALMPLDPKLAKIVVEGHRQKCLKEIVSIVSFLSVQDPRERPLSFQQKADEKHGVDKDKTSDFISILNFANRVSKDIKTLTNKDKKEYFRKNFISPVRFNEWNDIYRQVVEVIHGFGWRLNCQNVVSKNTPHPQLGLASHVIQEIPDQALNDNRYKASYENLHKALVSGFISNIGFNYENVEYIGARGIKFLIFPGSSQFKRKPKWMFSSEIVETTKTYARNVAKIESEWLENIASHLIKRHYDSPVWSKKRRSAIVNERVTLYGLEVVSKRSVQYSRVNLHEAREIFIREGLVQGELDSKVDFYTYNLELVHQVEDLENKVRRRDILVDDELMYQHYDSLIPEGVFDGLRFEKWAKKLSKSEKEKYLFDFNTLVQKDISEITQDNFPDTLSMGSMNLPLEYTFDPLGEHDGATVTIPVVFLNDINMNILEWGVYGFLFDKIVALLRALPKNIRKLCVPVPNYAQAIFESIDFQKDRLSPLKTIISKHTTRIVGFIVDETVWDNQELDSYLVLSIKVVDEKGKVLGVGKDISKLKVQFQHQKHVLKKKSEDVIYYDWGFGDIEITNQVKEYGISVEVYNCLEEYKGGVKLSYKASKKEADTLMKNAITKLIKLKLQNQFESKIKSNDLKSLSMSLKLKQSESEIINRAIDLSFFDDQELPFTKKEFDSFYNHGLNSFEETKQKIESIINEIFQYKKNLDAKLNVRKIPLNFIQLYSDVNKELDGLFGGDFISAPLIYLQRYKFYIQAFENRLGKAKFNLQRDKGFQLEADDLRAKLAKLISSKNIDSKSAGVIEAKFLIRELWVSWYLQNVKTIQSVSSKRVNEYIKSI